MNELPASDTGQIRQSIRATRLHAIPGLANKGLSLDMSQLPQQNDTRDTARALHTLTEPVTYTRRPCEAPATDRKRPTRCLRDEAEQTGRGGGAARFHP